VVLEGLDGRATGTEVAGRHRADPVRLGPHRIGWPAAWVAAAIVLFLLTWHEARQMAVQSDGASVALQAWQMLHGNLLLRGWYVTDVSFYTTELPVYMLVEAVRGLRTDVVTISAALNYTLLVAGAAFVAKGRVRGRAGIVRALLAAGIMLAPSAAAANWLLNDSDHAATAIWVLLVLLVIDRCDHRWYVPVIAAAVLAWAIVGDPLVEIIGAAPLAIVSGVRACQGLVRRREALRAQWYELSLAAAAVASVAAGVVATRLIQALGGWVPSAVGTHFVGIAKLPSNLRMGFEDFLSLFSADFFGQKIGVGLLPIVVHLAGACLVALAIWLALRGFWRGEDLVAGVLVAAIACDLVAYVLLYTITFFNIREIAPVFAFGATLAGRVLGPPLVRNRLEPLLAAGLACYLLTLGPAALIVRPRPPDNIALTAWLENHHLSNGIAGYWQANSVTLDSGAKITMRSVTAGAGGKTLIPDRWELDLRQMDPDTNDANFLVATVPGAREHTVTEGQAIATFGRPAHVYRYQGYRILVWNKNLLRDLARR
jgi:hypothetical protein